MDYIFKNLSGLGLDLALDCFWSRSRNLGLEICQSQSRSWSRKNYRVLVSVWMFVILTKSLLQDTLGLAQSVRLFFKIPSIQLSIIFKNEHF